MNYAWLTMPMPGKDAGYNNEIKYQDKRCGVDIRAEDLPGPACTDCYIQSAC